MNTCTPSQVANEFLQLAKQEKRPLTPMELQKHCFFAHGWHLALFDRPLIDEEPQAWTYGPVFESLYHQFKEFKSNPIERLALSWDWRKKEAVAPFVEDQGMKDLIKRVWEIYKDFNAAQLSNITHQQGTPWSQVFKVNAAGEAIKGIRIPNGITKKYFVAQSTA